MKVINGLTPESSNAVVSAIERADKYKGFKKELEALINKHSIDSDLNMHAFVIADYVVTALHSLRIVKISEDKLK